MDDLPKNLTHLTILSGNRDKVEVKVSQLKKLKDLTLHGLVPDGLPRGLENFELKLYPDLKIDLASSLTPLAASLKSLHLLKYNDSECIERKLSRTNEVQGKF